jgi:hypothetical protein
MDTLNFHPVAAAICAFTGQAEYRLVFWLRQLDYGVKAPLPVGSEAGAEGARAKSLREIMTGVLSEALTRSVRDMLFE